MTAYPTERDLAKTFLQYKVGKALESTDFGDIKEQTQASKWPFELLNNEDLVFLKRLRITWSEVPGQNDITNLLDEEVDQMTDAGLYLTLVHDVQSQSSVVFEALPPKR